MGALEALPSSTPPAVAPVALTGTSLDQILRIAAVVADGGMFGPYRGRPEAAATVMLQALELGLSPLQGLTSIHIIEGRPALSAELMRALVVGAGHDIQVVEMTDQLCRLAGRRAGQADATVVTFSMDDARRAGVAGKQPWKQYPQAMLLARATTLLCRAVFPDVLAGVSYTPEELSDGDVTADTAVEVIGVTAEPAADDQLEVIAELQGQLGLDADGLAAGISAATTGRATGPEGLSVFDADLVIARMDRRLNQLQQQHQEEHVEQEEQLDDEHDDEQQGVDVLAEVAV